MPIRPGQQVQMNISVYPELIDDIAALADRHGWSKRWVVETAVRLLELIEQADVDTARLYACAATSMPKWLDRQKVEPATFRDGRPALKVNNEWYIAEDGGGDLMAVRKDGGAVGHTSGGRIEVIHDIDIEAAAAASTALN